MTFEPKHDADQLGPLVADPADEPTPGGTLCSLADLVAWVMYRDAGMPRRPAATRMVDKLGVTTPPLYLTNRDTWATRLPALHEWWPKDDGSSGGVVCQLVKASAYRATDLGGHAYEPGPWQMLDGSSGASRYQERLKVVKPRAAMPGVYGEAGAWQVLRDAWCSDDKATGDKAMKRHGSTLDRLAIPMSVAIESLGYGRTDELAADLGHAAELQKLPDRNDGPGCRALYDEWVKLGGEKEGAGRQLATRLNCTARTIQQRIKPHRDAIELQTKAARASKRPKPKGGGAGSKLQTVWSGRATTNTR